jgi:aminotransferase EvaB
MAIGASLPVNDLRRSWLVSSPEVRDAVARVIKSGWYVHGTEHAAFEQELAEYIGVRHVAGVASGTDALALAMLAVGCRGGSEIITAANAGGYASGAAAQIGAGIVYSDVDPQTLLVTRQTLERVIGPATNAVVVTHLYGNVADVGSIVELCRPKGIAVIEDCAQVIGGADPTGRRAGSLGDIATFSFYPTKNLGAAGDGGAVATDDDAIDRRVRSLRQYGWSAKYRIAERSGRNSRLDEIQAAVLRIGLPYLDGFNERRRAIAGRYAEACKGAGMQPVTGANCETVAHLAVVRTNDRGGLRAVLREHGIETDIHYPVPDHRQPGLEPPVRTTDLRECERAADEILTLPCFPQMTDEEVGRVAGAIAAFGGIGA